jgi:hypothetical protein
VVRMIRTVLWAVAGSMHSCWRNGTRENTRNRADRQAARAIQRTPPAGARAPAGR